MKSCLDTSFPVPITQESFFATVFSKPKLNEFAPLIVFPEPNVFLTWSNVAKYIDELLSKNLYLEEKKIESKTEIEEPKELQYYSKDNPENLMTDEMLKRVPELYAQEDVDLADKQVHAAYIIPFRSNWTWYMTEYDKESGDAFGLVLKIKPEWGYFNIHELEELNVIHLLLFSRLIQWR